MDPMLTPPPNFNQALSFWTRIWQAQIDQSLVFWGAWAQMIPHDSARDLAREADAKKR